MVTQHFGFNRELFRSHITGADVFVGPQTVATMAGLKKSLVANDAISTVSGPVGAGKTILVNRAIESAGDSSIVVPVARMRLGGADVLDLLLDILGMNRLPSGVIQRFSLFRKRLKELEDSGVRVLVVVEDGPRLSADTVAELEALTAADAGESQGANIVLMGDEHLNEFLREPLLARLRQRIRQQHSIGPLSEAELRGYLRHCFRLAGRDFESIFAADAGRILHELSGGIPRITNNLIESTLRSALSKDLDRVPSSLLVSVAQEEYSLSPQAIGPEHTSTGPEAATDIPATTDPVIAFAEDIAEPEVEPEIAELIQDTVPDLAILTPELTAFEYPLPLPEPKPVDLSRQPVLESTDVEAPRHDIDSSMEELIPDLTALEEALTFTEDSAKSADQMPGDFPDGGEKDAPACATAIPEITLDHAINVQLDKPSVEKRDTVGRATLDIVDAPDIEVPTLKTTANVNHESKADTAIERIAASLAKAKSIEDVDDKMAETLFGGELDLAAATFDAPPAAIEPARQEIDPPETTVLVVGSDNSTDADTVDEHDSINIVLEDQPRVERAGLDLSASQRLKTVRALNADHLPSSTDPQPMVDVFQDSEATPESIEDQINTSMTQTEKVLSISAPEIDDDDDPEKDKSGFFSRFKRS